MGAENRGVICFGKFRGRPRSNIREKLDEKAIFSGLPQTKKNGGKNFGGGKQEGNSLREVHGGDPA